MKILINKNNSGYSVILALLIIGFLLVLGTGIFNLVLKEMKDNKAMGDYIKAYAGAEAGRELALLQIKKHGYGYYDKISHNINSRSIVLSENPLSVGSFKSMNDVLLSFDIGSMASEYAGTLDALEYNIIPLFYVNDLGEQKVLNINFSVIFGNESDLSWNIIGESNGISGKGNEILGIKKTLTVNGFIYEEEDINSFLVHSESNYLVLLNSGNSGIIKYHLKSVNDGESFTVPETSIISSAEVGNYKQNLVTNLNNTEFLNILKYSIYSN